MVDSIKCLECINDVREDVQGHDPRTWMKACAIDTILKGGNSSDFKQCLEKKIRKEVKDITDPKAYVDSLYDKIKGKCS